MMQRFFLLFLVALSFSLTVQGRNFANIDTFSTFQPALFLNIGPTSAPSGVWYSPYGEAAGTSPAVIYHDTTDALGGQRDLICGHYSQSADGSSATVSIEPVETACSVGISLNFFGSCYVQWDGADNAGTSNPFPGANLSSSPGIGSAGNPHSVDGQTMDFTFGGFATAITSTIRADHDVFYYYNVLNLAGQTNNLRFFTAGGEAEYTFDAYYTNPNWTNPSFDWTSVVGFQVRIQTAELTGDPDTAVDTDFRFVHIVGYEIRGEVFVDCGCTGTPSSFTQGVTVNLFNSLNQQIDTTQTDVNGEFIFPGQGDGNYRACVASGVTLCSSSPQCVDFTLQDFIDPPVIQFATTVITTLTPPANTQINCGDCSTSTCLGNAVQTGCTGTQEITNPTDQTSGDSCRQIITRTWTSTDGSITRTQTITIVDNAAPTLVNPAQSSSSECGVAGDTVEAWLARNADASVTDCNTVTWSNNYPGTPVLCGTVTVTFIARDNCNLQTSTTASFTINDSTAPVQVQAPTPSGAACDSKGTSVQTAYSTWLNNRAGATASDSCDTDLTWTNNAPAVQNGCNTVQTVTWTVRDDCGNTLSITSQFTVSDSQPPQITTPAQNANIQCTSGGSQNAIQNWINTHGGSQATDNCIANDASLVWSNDWDGTAPSGCAAGVPVVFTVTDPCGFTATTSATFSVSDNTPPQLTRPASGTTVQCSGGDGSVQTAFQQWLANNGGATATDDCSTVNWSNDASTAPADGCTNGLTVTFTAQDSCNGMTVTTTATFTVQDSVPPTVTTPPSSTQADCSTDVNAAFQQWLATAGGAQATDNCGSASFVNDFTGTGPSTGCNAPTPVRFSAIDQCGIRASPITATFTVTDSTGPTITTQATNLGIQCDGNTQQTYRDWLAANGNAQASDNCGSVTWSNNGPASVTVACTTTQTVVFTVRDFCGLTAATTATVSITDAIAPTLTTPASDGQTECSSSADASFQQWLSSRAGAQATDNCGGVSWTNDWVDGSWVDTGCERTAVVTFAANDQCGNSITTTAQYRISNTQPPRIVTPASPLSAECDGTASNAFDQWVANHGGATAADACTSTDQLVWSNTAGASPTGCSNAEVTFTVTDPCGGSASTTAIFSLVDTTRPQFDTPPSDPRVECDGSGNVAQYQSWVSTYGGAVASDRCSFSVALTINAPATGPVGCGTVPATVTAADQCGNSISVTTSFTVVDTVAPTFAPPASNSQVQCSGDNDAQLQQWLSSHGGASAVDTCYSVDRLVWSNNFQSLTGTGCGRGATVTFTVTDGCGQRASTTATFSISDSIAPTLTNPASNGVFECVSSGNTAQINSWLASNGGATAVDECSAVSWSNDFTTAPVPCAGPVTVVFTASDACGNVVTTAAAVSVVDTLQPEFTNFPPDRTLLCNDPTDSSSTGFPGATDQCDTQVDITESDNTVVNPTEGFCPGDTIITRTFALVDNCGNTNVRDQVIVVTLPTGPCRPEPCPPCENEPECCASSMEPLPCNPVPCNPVPCRGDAGCYPVPCLSVECDACEPIYIYVFDDDDNTSFETSFNASGASKNVFSVFLMVVLALALLI